eukprot:scaffold5395_cov126-Cylindrotheca_fusiformis.AAC.13
MGDRNFIPLQEGIEARLKQFICPETWKRAKAYTRYYIRRQQRSRNETKNEDLPNRLLQDYPS